MVTGVKNVDGPSFPHAKGNFYSQEWILMSNSIKTDCFPVMVCLASVSK